MNIFAAIITALGSLSPLAASSPALITSNYTKLDLRQASQTDSSFIGYVTVGSTCEWCFRNPLDRLLCGLETLNNLYRVGSELRR
jgi:hypothetical protein